MSKFVRLGIGVYRLDRVDVFARVQDEESWTGMRLHIWMQGSEECFEEADDSGELFEKLSRALESA